MTGLRILRFTASLKNHTNSLLCINIFKHLAVTSFTKPRQICTKSFTKNVDVICQKTLHLLYLLFSLIKSLIDMVLEKRLELWPLSYSAETLLNDSLYQIVFHFRY